MALTMAAKPIKCLELVITLYNDPAFNNYHYSCHCHHHHHHYHHHHHHHHHHHQSTLLFRSDYNKRGLEKRRFQRRCVHIYKCLNGLTHHELTLVTQQEQHSYNTRNKANLKIPSIKRNWDKQRTGYHAVSDFNSLDKTIRASDNVNILKRLIFNSLI